MPKRTSDADATLTGRVLRGETATLNPNTEFTVVGEDLGKEYACLEVKFGGQRGYVLASERIALDR